MREGKTIRVHSESAPVVGRIRVERGGSHKVNDSTAIQRRGITVTSFSRSEPGGPSLQDWAKHFAESIERLLPSSEHSFVPKAVSIERETFYRALEQNAQDEPPRQRRVRVTRRRVRLLGAVQQAKP